MGTTATIQATVDATLKDQASAVLAEIGMTVEDAVRLLLTQVVEQQDLPVSLYRADPNIPGSPPYHEIGEGKRFASYDDWFRSEVEAGIREADDPNTVWVTQEEVSQRLASFRAECAERIANKAGRG